MKLNYSAGDEGKLRWTVKQPNSHSSLIKIDFCTFNWTFGEESCQFQLVRWAPFYFRTRLFEQHAQSSTLKTASCTAIQFNDSNSIMCTTDCSVQRHIFFSLSMFDTTKLILDLFASSFFFIRTGYERVKFYCLNLAVSLINGHIHYKQMTINKSNTTIRCWNNSAHFFLSCFSPIYLFIFRSRIRHNRTSHFGIEPK